jgi:trimeric autotransporter adhesin
MVLLSMETSYRRTGSTNFPQINGLMVGAINPFAAGFPNVLTFYATDITDLDARANFWGGEAPTTDITRQANVAGAMLTGSYSDDPSKAGQPGFWPLSTDANLTDLSLSTGTLTPVFASDTTNYTVRVPASFTSFAVTPTKSDTNASMAQFVGASGTTPFTGELGGRETIIRVVVTAEDGTTKTYKVTVTRFNFTPQIITFTPVASITATTATYALVASANSGLTVAFDSTTNDICTVSGTTLTPVKAGLCVITASQAGNDTFYAPASVNKSIVITRAAQSITGFNPSAMTTLSSPQTLSATKGLGSAPVTFSTNSSGVCSIVGTSLTVVAPGTCVVAASQAEDSRYAAASVMKSITITKVAQSITGFNPSAMTTLSSPQTLSATKGLGTAPVTFSTSSTGVCAIVGTSLTAVAAGTCVVTASQAEDGRYAAANNVTKSITISKAAQAIVFTPVASLSAAAPSYALTATAGVGATVAFASTTPLVCTVSGTTLTPAKAGTCSITASQVGNATYLAATNVSKSITINLASQATLTVSNSTKFAFKKGVPVTLTSSGGSGTGNAVTFSVRGTGCSISAGALTVATTTRPGSLVSCSVTATRAGNAIYLPATSTATNFFFQNR